MSSSTKMHAAYVSGFSAGLEASQELGVRLFKVAIDPSEIPQPPTCEPPQEAERPELDDEQVEITKFISIGSDGVSSGMSGDYAHARREATWMEVIENWENAPSDNPDADASDLTEMCMALADKEQVAQTSDTSVAEDIRLPPGAQAPPHWYARGGLGLSYIQRMYGSDGGAPSRTPGVEDMHRLTRDNAEHVDRINDQTKTLAARDETIRLFVVAQDALSVECESLRGTLAHLTEDKALWRADYDAVCAERDRAHNAAKEASAISAELLAQRDKAVSDARVMAMAVQTSDDEATGAEATIERLNTEATALRDQLVAGGPPTLVADLIRQRDDARSWARHGYEIGQRSCTWSDQGVAPQWLTEGHAREALMVSDPGAVLVSQLRKQIQLLSTQMETKAGVIEDLIRDRVRLNAVRDVVDERHVPLVWPGQRPHWGVRWG